jgi:hypothetical protein
LAALAAQVAALRGQISLSTSGSIAQDSAATSIWPPDSRNSPRTVADALDAAAPSGLAAP